MPALHAGGRWFNSWCSPLFTPGLAAWQKNFSLLPKRSEILFSFCFLTSNQLFGFGWGGQKTLIFGPKPLSPQNAYVGALWGWLRGHFGPGPVHQNRLIRGQGLIPGGGATTSGRYENYALLGWKIFWARSRERGISIASRIKPMHPPKKLIHLGH